MKRNNLGLVHIYCGLGKGKTTAAVGLTVRAAGNGLKVYFLQFLKSGKSSELKILKSLENVTVAGTKPTEKFSFQMTAEEKKLVSENNEREFKQAVAQIEEDGEYNMFVMDEVLGSIEAGLLEEKPILDFLKNKPENLEVVLTGRHPSESLVEMADYVSRIEKVKHPFDKGVPAREGIEK